MLQQRLGGKCTARAQPGPSWGFLKRSLQAVDAQNGNLALHISAQNGHMGLTSFLLDSRNSSATLINPCTSRMPVHVLSRHEEHRPVCIQLMGRAAKPKVPMSTRRISTAKRLCI